MLNTGECIHGVEMIFDGLVCIQHCEKCQTNALGAISGDKLDKFMTKEEQKVYGILPPSQSITTT